MRFEVSRLVGYKSVTSGVRFIKCILGKCFPIGPYFFELISGVPFGLCTFHKLALHFIKHFFLLLTHRFTQRIRITFGKACQTLRQQHHLLLIHCNSIGIFEIFFHLGHIVTDDFFAVLTCDKIWNVGNWSGTIQSVHGNQILKAVGFQIDEVLLHTRTFKLEGAVGLTFLIKFKGFFIV